MSIEGENYIENNLQLTPAEPIFEPKHSEQIAEQEKIEAERQIREWAKATIQEWHEKAGPDYVFVTETAAVPYGYVLKEAWKAAYSGEPRPSFYRIDPRAVRDRKSIDSEKREKFDKSIKNYFQKRIKKDDANIIVFDESGSDGENQLKLCDLNEEWRYQLRGGTSLELAVAGIHNGYNNYLDKREGKIWTEWSGPSGSAKEFMEGKVAIYEGEEYKSTTFNRPTSRIFGTKSPYRPYSEDEKLLEKEKRRQGREFTLTGAIVKHPEQRRRAMDFVKELRRIGKEAGEELRAELEKEKQKQE